MYYIYQGMLPYRIKLKFSNKTKIYIFISLFNDKIIETEYHLQHFWENNWIVSFQR